MEKKQERFEAEQEKTEGLLREALEQEMGEIPELSITVSELRELDRQSRKKKQRRAVKIAGIAAAVLCVMAGLALWSQNAVPADAGKDTEQRVEKTNGEILINDGDGIGKSGVTIINETDRARVRQWRKAVPKLGIPQWVPAGYAFESLNIELYSEMGFSAEYIYKKENTSFSVEQIGYDQEGEKTRSIEGNIRTGESQKGTAYITDDEEGSMAVVYLEQGHLKVTGKLSDSQLVKVLDGIEISE